MKREARPKNPPFPGALTAAEAAVIAGKTPQAISYAVRVGALKATKDEGRTSPLWIDIMDLRLAYPPEKRHGNLKQRVFRLSNAQQDEVLGFTPSVNGQERRPTPIRDIRETND